MRNFSDYKYPLRKDVLTNKQYFNSELVRIVIKKNGETKIDLNREIQGRGVYFLQENLLSLKKSKKIEKIVNNKNGNFSQIKNDLLKIIKI